MSKRSKDGGQKSQDYLVKVLVVGEQNTGKTSIVQRFVHNDFSTSYKPTIGVDFALKKLVVQGKSVRLQLWDIAGQERFTSMVRSYYKEAVGALVVHDISVPHPFDSVTAWKQDIDNKVQLPDGSPIPCVLLGNKSDLPHECHMEEKLNAYCTDHQFFAWFETSAKENKNIETALLALLKHILSLPCIVQPPEDKSPEQLEQERNSIKLGVEENDLSLGKFSGPNSVNVIGYEDDDYYGGGLGSRGCCLNSKHQFD